MPCLSCGSDERDYCQDCRPIDATQFIALCAIIEKIRRLTIPGECSADGLPEIDQLAHAAESVLCGLVVGDGRRYPARHYRNGAPTDPS